MFNATINFVSKELTAKQRIQFKDTQDAIKIDKYLESNPELILDVDYYGTLQVQNDRSESGSYEQYIIVTKDGEKYTTGSDAFLSAFEAIVSEMKDSDEEYAIRVYRMPSKNREGKYYLTCSII